MRTSYLVCYDICDDKRLRKVFQLMRAFGDHLAAGKITGNEWHSKIENCR
jgi:hypothetical protein